MLADTLIKLYGSSGSAAAEDDPWPHVLGTIAYDTPYFGLNPSVFAVRSFLHIV